MTKNRTDMRLGVLFTMMVVFGVFSRCYVFFAPSAVDLVTAYLDPGTCSMIISAVIGIFATLVLGFKTLGYKVKNLFSRKNVTGGEPRNPGQSDNS